MVVSVLGGWDGKAEEQVVTGEQDGMKKQERNTHSQLPWQRE